MLNMQYIVHEPYTWHHESEMRIQLQKKKKKQVSLVHKVILSTIAITNYHTSPASERAKYV